MKTENIISHHLSHSQLTPFLIFGCQHMCQLGPGSTDYSAAAPWFGFTRMGVNSTLVRYFSCLNAPLFISHFLQTCYKSQLRTGKTDLHSKNQNFTKQTQDCKVKIYKHIFLYVIGNLHFESIKRGRRGVVECLDNNNQW